MTTPTVAQKGFSVESTTVPTRLHLQINTQNKFITIFENVKNVVRGLYGPISLLFPFANLKPWYLNESISTRTCFTLLSTAPVHRCRAFDSFTRRLRLLVFYVLTYLLTYLQEVTATM